MDKKVLQNLESILHCKILSCEKLSGGSGDIIFLLETSTHKKYVYKSGQSSSISSQITFYQEYFDLPYLPMLIYSNPNELLIEYLELDKSKSNYNKVKIMQDLTEFFLSRYKIVNFERFGFVSGFLTGDTFAEFLIDQIKEARKRIADLFSSQDLDSLILIIKQVYTEEIFTAKYLLHGDFGFHNFFYSSDTITGIIDPDPIIGHPLYDFLFAYCSTPGQINPDSYNLCLDKFTKYYPVDLSKKVEYLKIALFKRISSCSAHHPQDLNEYKKIWNDIESFQ